MTRGEMQAWLGMEPHVEGGLFCELFRERQAEGRGASGAIYYALGPGEHADFHALDCDEYWLYHAGDPLEVWVYGPDGALRVERLGLGEGAQPCVLIPPGCLFGARTGKDATEATLLTCITVPQFSYAHYRLLGREEMLALHPDAEDFYA